MNLLPKLSTQAISLKGWSASCRAYALGAGLLAAVIDFAIDLGAAGWSWRDVLEAGAVGLLVTLVVGLAFRMAREVSMALALRVAQGLEETVKTGCLPQLSSYGWPVFERIQNSVHQLLEPRDARIAELEHALNYHRRLAEDMLGLELVLEPDGALRWVNPGATALTGYTREECLAAADPLALWVYVKDRPSVREMLALALQGEAQEGLELRLQRKDESLCWCSVRCYPLHGSEGEISGVRVSAQDIQPRKDADLKLLETVAALRRAQALKEHYLSRSNDERMRLTALLETLRVGILFVDRDRRVVYLNQICADMWALGERKDVVGMRDDALLAQTAALRIDADAYHQHVEQVIAQRSEQVEYDIQCVDGRVVRERSAVVPGVDGARPIGRVWIYEDISASLQAQERLLEQSERDALTDLHNRRRFHEDLVRQLAESLRRGEQLGVLLFDLDDFKSLNDAFGYPAGDEVLQRLAHEVSRVTRRNERLFRYEADKFVMLVGQPSRASLTQLASRVVAQVSELAFCFDDAPVRVSISLGVALTPLNGQAPEALMHAAEHALREAKREGKNRWVLATRTSPEKSEF